MSDAATASTDTQTTQEPSDEALEHAMATGFSGVRGTEPPAPMKTDEATTTDDQTPNPTTTDATDQTAATGDEQGDATTDGSQGGDATTQGQTEQDKVEAAKAVLAGLSEDQLKAVLGEVPVMRERVTAVEQNMQKVFGRFGEVNRVLQALSKGGTAQPVKIDPAKLKRTATTFDADAATALAEDLQEILSELPRGPAGEPVDLDGRIDSRVQAAVQTVTARVNEMFLTQAHPDWMDAVGTADFRLWLETRPAEERAQIRESEDAAFLLPKFNEFKSWRDAAAKARANKGKRLESNVDPKGQPRTTTSAQAAPDEEAAFNAGFRAVRGAA